MRCALGEGGPLRRLEARFRLADPVVRVAVTLAVTWVPFVVLGMAIEATGTRIPALHDIATHVRMLVGVPVLLLLDDVFPRVCRVTIEYLERNEFIPPAHASRYERTVARATRLTDWWVPEAVAASCALAIGIGSLLGPLPMGRFSPRSELTIAEYWYALFALPLFEFMFLRSLWRWMVWVKVLVGISRIPLALEPTHPDRTGGLSVLRRPSLAYCATMLFVISAVLAAEWGWRFKFATLASYLPVVGIAAGLALLIAFAPLLVFLPQLMRLRRESIDELGGIAAHAGRAFRHRAAEATGHELLVESGIQNLSSIRDTYRYAVNVIYLVPISKRDAITVLLAAVVPMLPGVLVRVSRDDWLTLMTLLSP